MTTRAERRATAREAAKQLLRRPPEKRRFRWDYTLGFAGVAVGIVIVLAPPQTAASARTWLLILFGVLVYPALHFAEWLLPTKPKWLTYSGSVLLLMLSTFAFGQLALSDFLPPLRITRDPYFVAVGPSFIVPNRQALGDLAAVFEQNGQYTIVPLNVSLFIELTNLQPAQSMIDKYGVAIKTKKGNWVELKRVETRNDEIYWVGSGLQMAKQIGLPRLDALLSLRWLQPRENVRGWSFFEYPPEFSHEEFESTFRVTVGDAAGLVFTSKSLTIGDDKNNMGIQGAMLEVRPTYMDKDLSRAAVKYVP